MKLTGVREFDGTELCADVLYLVKKRKCNLPAGAFDFVSMDCVVNGVNVPPGKYRFETREIVEVSSGAFSVKYVGGYVNPGEPGWEPLPLPQVMEQPMEKEFRLWAEKLGLLAPERYEEVEDPEEKEYDDYEDDIPLDSDSLDVIGEGDETEPVDERSDGGNLPRIVTGKQS